MAKYKVRNGDTIYDVCYNANGSLYAIAENIALNNIDSYTPELIPDVDIDVSDIVRNNAAVIAGNIHPFNSSTIDKTSLDAWFYDSAYDVDDFTPLTESRCDPSSVSYSYYSFEDGSIRTIVVQIPPIQYRLLVGTRYFTKQISQQASVEIRGDVDMVDAAVLSSDFKTITITINDGAPWAPSYPLLASINIFGITHTVVFTINIHLI